MFLITKHLGLELLLVSPSVQDFSKHFVVKGKKHWKIVNHVFCV